MSYALLGRSVNLSEAAVRQRVQRLIEAGVLRIVCLVDPEQMGFSRAVTVGVKCRGSVETVAKAINGAQQLAVTSGSIDIMASILATDDEDLLQKVNEIRRLEGVREVEIFLHLSRRVSLTLW
jgi:Lrp/AsnC family transcriptional regulator for asnA, asnC and gidA